MIFRTIIIDIFEFIYIRNVYFCINLQTKFYRLVFRSINNKYVNIFYLLFDIKNKKNKEKINKIFYLWIVLDLAIISMSLRYFF